MSKIGLKRSHEDAHMSLQVITPEISRKRHKADFDELIADFECLSLNPQMPRKKIEVVTVQDVHLLITALSLLYVQHKGILKNEASARPSLAKRVRFAE